MTKRSKWIYIIGAAVIVIIGVTIVLLALLAGGLLNSKKNVIVISSGSEEFVYDGSAHTNGEWNVESGLPSGFAATVSFTGSRTEAGTSDNTFSAKIKSESDGTDVTSDYAIEYRFGKLTVKPLSVSLTTVSGTKVYDGEPLACAEWKITSETELLEGHSITRIVMPAEQTEVGVVQNYVSEIVVSEGDRDVTANYQFVYHLGELTVTPRNLTVRSGSAEKVYNGEPLTCGDWDIVSLTKPVLGHQIAVGVSGIRTEIGMSENTVSEVRILSGGRDVTINYAVKTQLGALTVRGNTPETPPPGGEGEGGNLSTSGDIDSIGGGDGKGGDSSSGSGGGGEGGSGEGSQSPALKIFSDASGKVYLRLMSFGDYNGKGWERAEDYSGRLDGVYGLNYLTGIALKKSGFESVRMRVDMMGGDYLLPYYMDTDLLNYAVQTSDVAYSGDSSSIYELYYFPYRYVTEGATSVDLGAYRSAEAAYASFVRQNYLSVPDSTRSFLKSIIAAEKFQSGDTGIVGAVASFIQNAAKYNLDYNRKLDSESDVVVSFLRDYGEGICGHYASAATMLYRALGIPARYTIGYTGNAVANQWTEISGKNAHAWVEVYIDGMGWVQVEVTGSDPSDPILGGLRLKPVNEFMKYDGVHTLVHSGVVQGLSKLLEEGYTYRAEISGSRRDVGIGTCAIEKFQLFDRMGEDVTDRFEIEFSQGKLQVYLQEITVTTGSSSKVYDGTALTEEGCEIDGMLLAGHTASLSAVGSRTSVGRSINAFEIVITDAAGKDVTSFYKINAKFGDLEVTPRKIIVTAGNLERVYNGRPLICPDYSIGSEYEIALAAGHTAIVRLTGSQTNVGKSENTVSSVRILDENGKDVTDNYSVDVKSGQLIVRPR